MSGYPFFFRYLQDNRLPLIKPYCKRNFLYDYAFDNPLIASAQTLKIFLKKVVEKSLTYGENMVSFETYFFAEARKNTTGKPNIKDL